MCHLSEVLWPFLAPLLEENSFYGIACEYVLNPEKLLFDAAIISCSSSLCFLHPSSHPSPVVTPYCCPYSLLIKSKLFSITFIALQNLTPIQPSSLTFYFPCSILYTSHYLDHYLGNWTMFSNDSALDIMIAFTLESLLLVGLNVTLGQRLAEMVDFENRKEKGRLYLSNTLPNSSSLKIFSRSFYSTCT